MSLILSTLAPIQIDIYLLYVCMCVQIPADALRIAHVLRILRMVAQTYMTMKKFVGRRIYFADSESLSSSYCFDNNKYRVNFCLFVVCMGRVQVGEILAQELIDGNFIGRRPTTLVGFSLGARVIFYCLKVSLLN